jgi:hypothetical protein
VSDGEGQFLEDLADMVDEVGETSNVVPDDDVFLPGDEDEDDELGRTAESFVLGSKS